jgi:hypothetical protein
LLVQAKQQKFVDKSTAFNAALCATRQAYKTRAADQNPASAKHRAECCRIDPDAGKLRLACGSANAQNTV